MFGYVQPLKPELKMKEYDAYRGYYCGLCKAIKENYTNAARFMLNYDCATLSLLLSAMSDTLPTVDRQTCVANPIKKKIIVCSDESKYAAAINVLLGFGKIQDTAMDEGRLSAKALSLFFRRVAKRAAKDYGDLADVFDTRLANLHALEALGSDNIDAVSSEFAHLLAAVFSLAPFAFLGDADKKALRHFGYNLGRWIYISDAVDDLEKDHKSGSYNVFLQRDYRDIAKLKEEITEEAQFNLHYSLAEACKAYELLDIKRDKPLLDNIMYLGLAKKTEDILKGDTHGSV